MKSWDISKTAVGYYRILQIMAPSVKMKAVYKGKDGEYSDPVVCLALLECVEAHPDEHQDADEFIEQHQDELEFTTDIVPMVMDIECGFLDIANDYGEFLRYEFV